MESTPKRRFWAVRYSLRSLVIAILLVGAVMMLWSRFSPWILERTLQGHTGFIHSVTYSPDGQKILTGSWDATARVWNASSGEQVAVLLGHKKSVDAAAYSPNGLKIVTGDHTGEAKIWDARTFRETATLLGHTGSIEVAIFSQDSRLVATGSGSSGNAFDGTVRIWEAENGTNLKVLKKRTELSHRGIVNDVAFSPSGQSVVAGSADNTARVWDVASDDERIVLVHTGGVRSVRFSNDGETILTASDDHSASIWNAITGKELHKLEGHSDAVVYATFSNGGQYILTASGDKTARVWDAATGNTQAILSGHNDTVWIAAFSMDDMRVATVSKDGTARIWNSENGQTLAILKHPSSVSLVRFSPDGRHLVTASGHNAYIWCRRRPEPFHGLLMMPELWLVLVFACALVVSLRTNVKATNSVKIP